jgi:ribosome-associated translation inhibitor RaiA
MTTTLQFLGLNIHNSWYHMLDQHLDHWQRLTAVSATEVVMEREREGKPAFRVRVSLKVSGPDLHTEAHGPTLKAALVEATQDLERQIQDRQIQRVERRASERQLCAASGLQIHE